jgi:hypothetical protein
MIGGSGGGAGGGGGEAAAHLNLQSWISGMTPVRRWFTSATGEIFRDLDRVRVNALARENACHVHVVQRVRPPVEFQDGVESLRAQRAAA